MNTNPMEILLARLFANPTEVERFLQDRENYARTCGFTAAQIMDILAIDAASLRFAARSFERKRGLHGGWFGRVPALMNKDQRYWFPAKRYGWGWGPPIAWQGWAVLFVWFAVVATMAFVLMPRYRVGFLFSVLLMTVLLVVVCYAKGEPPAWRWGGPDASTRDR